MRFGTALLLVAGITSLLAPARVSAHAELTAAEPAAESVLGSAPDEIVLTFGAELDPDGSRFVVTYESGAEVGSGSVDLDVADRDVMRGSVEVGADGTYSVSWTAASIDGHAASGSYTFRVGAEEAPNTAMAARPDDRLVLIGIGLVALGCLAALRRAVRPR